MRVKAKRIGWDEILTPEQQLDQDPLDNDDMDLEGELEIVYGSVPGVGHIKVYLVDGQEADIRSIVPLDSQIQNLSFAEICNDPGL